MEVDQFPKEQLSKRNNQTFSKQMNGPSFDLQPTFFETAVQEDFDSILEFHLSISFLLFSLHKKVVKIQNHPKLMYQSKIQLYIFLPSGNSILTLIIIIFHQPTRVKYIIQQFSQNRESISFWDHRRVELQLSVFQGIFRDCTVFGFMRKEQNKQPVGDKLMNRCYSCKNTRRQLLMLKCSHDTCVKCAADNYFINCKNKLSNKKSRNNSYYCEKCLQQTELDAKTIETLRKYFMDNVPLDDRNKNGRKQKILERQHQERQRLGKVHKLDVQNTHRPKSLEIEIADRKRTLSKYLNQKQIEKFIEMQSQYGTKIKKLSVQNNNQKYQQACTPQSHNVGFTPLPNEYELKCLQNENIKKKEQPYQRDLRSINDSFEKFAEQQRYHHDYMKVNENLQILKGKNSQKVMPNHRQQMQYQIYHNGKGLTNPQLKAADRLLEEDMNQRGDVQTGSRHSSNSSNKVVGTIRSKRSPDHHTEYQKYSPTPPEIQQQQNSNGGLIIKKQRINSCKSEDNLQQINYNNQVKLINTEYHTRNGENTQDAWEMESKSTKKQSKTIRPDKNSSDTVDKILQTLQASQQRSPSILQKIKQKSTEKSRSRLSPERTERVEIYFCKIHQDQQIIYFCLKCNQLICSQCALHGSHKSHEIHSLKKSAVILRQTLAHSMNTLTKLLVEEESKQKILRQCLSEINLQCNKQKQQIRSSFENFIFHIDKKYKELLKEIEDKFTNVMSQYSQKLIESRNNYIYISKIKDNVCDTLQECGGFQDGTVSETSIGAARNQFGNFNVKRPRNKQNNNPSGIEYINKLTSRILELSEFLKNSNILLFSGKKQSLLSQNSSLGLSQSSNLLEEEKEHLTPETVTPPQGRSLFTRGTPEKRNKKIVVSSYSLNVKSRIRISQCDSIVESLVEMQQIVKSIKPQSIEYELKSLI